MDKYDKQINDLIEFRKDFDDEWSFGHGIFKFLSIGGSGFSEDQQKKYGCITMIRARPHEWCAETPEITNGVLFDDRLPNSSFVLSNLTCEQLEAMADWQRMLDLEFGRK